MEGKSIIIKRVRKKGHQGGHGGSWKVAYADFVTAMMAFFLLLWLISMVSPEKKAKVSQYFKHFSMFEKGGSSMFEAQPPGSLGTGSAPIPELVSADEIRGIGSGKTDEQQEVQREIEAKLPEFKDQIMVSRFEGGLRIELIEKNGSPMFPSGGNALTQEGKTILRGIAQTLGKGTSRIAIEGHTDARGFASSHYSNWELSTDRASAARKELEKNGLSPERLIRIAGYAATQPLIQDDPQDPRNRRITIVQFENEPSPALPQGNPTGAGEVTVQSAQVRKKIIRPGRQYDAVEQYLQK